MRSMPYRGGMGASAVRPLPPRLRVLVVDDHELVRGGIAAILRDGWEVCGEAGNGIEAIEKARDLLPDIVLLDVSMPIMSGTRAAKAIRAVAPETKIVFLSMHDSPTVGEMVKMAGADGFISKHCHAKEFRESLSAFHVGTGKP